MTFLVLLQRRESYYDYPWSSGCKQTLWLYHSGYFTQNTVLNECWFKKTQISVYMYNPGKSKKNIVFDVNA